MWEKDGRNVGERWEKCGRDLASPKAITLVAAAIKEE
ncbi:hypothetical protein QG37_03554 [Candidozyma auris]|uniref:Uncharacterized protein n=1 Tax=Candidozyma auris TaxID=498019 RepID=A0A0L0NZJ1_CANAR|nr:hypothetical protein QG37_03554 [[Candida] auris]